MLLHVKNTKLILTNAIDQHRQNILTEIFAYLQSVLKRYKNSKRNCLREIECDEMILNSLTINLNAIKILQPPHSSYNGFSVKDIFRKLREMSKFQFCQILRDCERSLWSSSDETCEKIKKPLEIKLEELEHKLQKMELNA